MLHVGVWCSNHWGCRVARRCCRRLDVPAGFPRAACARSPSGASRAPEPQRSPGARLRWYALRVSSEPDPLAAALDGALVALLREIERRLASGDVAAGMPILNLAEAYAWLNSPDQPHGGRAPPRPSGGQR